MLDLDIEQFWRDEETAHKDNCFSKESAQVALGIRMSDVCVFAEVRRDCEQAKVDDIRGLNLSTAGSINNGSLLTSMRAVMAAIQNYGRY